MLHDKNIFFNLRILPSAGGNQISANEVNATSLIRFGLNGLKVAWLPIMRMHSIRLKCSLESPTSENGRVAPLASLKRVELLSNGKVTFVLPLKKLTFVPLAIVVIVVVTAGRDQFVGLAGSLRNLIA